MSAEAITPAILQYIDQSAYPDSEQIASAGLSSSLLQDLSKRLSQSQDQVKEEIRSIGKDASSDIDTWISRAKELQADILRSRETARQIVADAEAGKELKSKVEDRKRKVDLLENEVAFQESVAARLDHIRHAKEVLEDVQECIVKGQFGRGLKRLEEAEESTNGLGAGGGSGVGMLLGRRAEKLRERLQEAVIEGWNQHIIVGEGHQAVIKSGVEELVKTGKALGIFDDLLEKLAKAFDRVILRPRMIGHNGSLPRVYVDGDEIYCKNEADPSTGQLFADLKAILDFLVRQLPADVAAPLSDMLLPTLSSRLEEEWLEPSVPLQLSEVPAFQRLLEEILDFADFIDEKQLYGGKGLREWLDNVSPTWLRKRREVILGDVRNLVFTGLRETKTVERVETQVIAKDDALAQGGQTGDDDWDTAWDEPEEQPAAADEDDGTSAWDVEGDEPAKEDAGDDDEAWGWGDGDENAPASPKAAKKDLAKTNGDPPQQAQEQEMTLRETFTVTSVPENLLVQIQSVIHDAETLSGPSYTNTPLAPASAGLYQLPNLALAIYRATAPTAYSKLPTGSMLIYNDANRLSDQLLQWQKTSPQAAKLRLQKDTEALEQFAKRAYTSEMDSQRTILRDLLDGAQDFANCTAEPFRSQAIEAVSQTIDRLRDVHTQWTPILSHSALLQSLGSLLHTITSRMTSQIEDLPDIGEEESRQLGKLCAHVSTARDLFYQEANGEGEAGGETRDMTFIYCPSWLKFQYLAEILESSLADIRYLWKEGELSLEFEAEEVVGLIEALFAESQLRRQAIQEVRRGGRR
ncbi:Hypothetical predicted protein [Lecanosticta acicola]|uniref:ZW10 C-terminal helical domain-containing protein n=1 Tax=Lecanosticta acicola TaxID=111012 RepID=A0AAI9EFS9_9PEZI|nr:Hypothetical predicted protein [Lecanosticta acicola]